MYKFNHEPFRVAHIMGKLAAGGVESVVYNYYRHIDRTKIQFDFYGDADSSFPFPEKLLSMGARYFTIPRYQEPHRQIPALIRHFRENKYQIVHSNMNSLSAISLYAAKRVGVPVRICHSHSTASLRDGGRTLIKYALRPTVHLFATDFCACSEQAGRWLFGDKKIDSGEVRLIRNAIDLKRFAFDEQVRHEVREQLGLSCCFVLGHVGRFARVKNHLFLVDIFAEVARMDSSARLLLVGDGPLRGVVEEKLTRYGLLDKVQFIRNVFDVERYYQAMDVFCFPSFYEGLGMTTVEAQAAGLPVIASRVVPADVVVSQLFQYVLLSDSSVIWAEKVFSMKGKRSLDTASTLASHGFDIEKEAKNLEKYYMELFLNHGL